MLDNDIRLLNFPPKAGVKLSDVEKFEEKDGLLQIQFFSDKLLKFPQKNFLRSTKKNPIWLSPFKPELFYTKIFLKNEKTTWVFRNKQNLFKTLVNFK